MALDFDKDDNRYEVILQDSHVAYWFEDGKKAEKNATYDINTINSFLECCDECLKEKNPYYLAFESYSGDGNLNIALQDDDSISIQYCFECVDIFYYGATKDDLMKLKYHLMDFSIESFKRRNLKKVNNN